MRWGVILAAICAAVVALQVLIWERRSGRRRPSTIGRVALAVMAIVFAIVALWHRRRLDAGTAGQPQPLPPRQAQLVGAVQ